MQLTKIRPIKLGGQPSGAASFQGALWVTDAQDDRIVRLGMDGSQTAFPLPRAGVQAADDAGHGVDAKVTSRAIVTW
jgi:hypothetical protein